MIKSLDLGDYLDYLYGTNVIIRVFINERGRQEGQRRRYGDKVEVKSSVMSDSLQPHEL